MKSFLQDENGVLSFEWILMLSILVIGIIAGLTSVRDALSIELVDIAVAVDSVDQGFYYPSIKAQVYFNQPGDTTTPAQNDNGQIMPGGTTGQVKTTGWHMTAGAQHNPINQESTGQESFEIHTKKPGVH